MPALRDTDAGDVVSSNRKVLKPGRRGQLDREESDASYTDTRSTKKRIIDRVIGQGRDTGGLKAEWDRDQYTGTDTMQSGIKSGIKAPPRQAEGKSIPGAPTVVTPKNAAPKPVDKYGDLAKNYSVTAPTVKVNPMTGETVVIDQGSLDKQQAALALIESAAQGNTPSAAGLQMKQGLQETLQMQMAAARSGRGGYNPAAMRQAQQAGAAQQQAVNQQMGILRAQEMATARGQYGDLTSSIVQQRAQANQYQAGLLQQASMQNQQMDYQTQTANQSANLQAQQQTLQGKLGYSQLAEGGLDRDARVKTAKDQITMAKKQLASAESEADRNFWLNVIGKASDVVASGIGSYLGG